MSPSADPSWQPEEVPADIALDFDPAAANALLDEAGYVDTDGDGVREMPDGSRDLTFRYAERTESENEPALREFITGWLADIGIATEVSVLRRHPADDVIGDGELRPLHVGVDAVRRSRPDAVVLHVRPGHHGPRRGRVQRRQLVRRRVRRDVRGAEHRARPRATAGDRPRDAAQVLHRGLLRRAVRGRRSAGVPDRPIRGVDTAAGRDRSGALHQHLAQLRQPHPDRRRLQWREQHRGCGSRSPRAPLPCSGIGGLLRCASPGQSRKSANSTGSGRGACDSFSARSRERSPRWRSSWRSASSCSASSTTTPLTTCSAAATCPGTQIASLEERFGDRPAAGPVRQVRPPDPPR